MILIGDNRERLIDNDEQLNDEQLNDDKILELLTDIKDFAFGDKEPLTFDFPNKIMLYRPIKIQPWMKPIKIVYPSEWEINIDKINDVNVGENDNPDSEYTIELTQTLTLLTVKVIKKKYIEDYDMKDASDIKNASNLKDSLYASLYCRSKFGGVKWIDIDFDLENLESFHKFIKSIEDKGMIMVHTETTRLMDNRCYITAEGDYAVDSDNQIGVMSIDTYEGNIELVMPPVGSYSLD